MTREASSVPVARGQLRRLDMLGTTSVYEVLENPHGDLVATRVIVAPGLHEGTIVRLTVGAVSLMEIVGSVAESRPTTVSAARSYG